MPDVGLLRTMKRPVFTDAEERAIAYTRRSVDSGFFDNLFAYLPTLIIGTAAFIFGVARSNTPMEITGFTILLAQAWFFVWHQLKLDRSLGNVVDKYEKAFQLAEGQQFPGEAVDTTHASQG